jgi:hypothetical protein
MGLENEEVNASDASPADPSAARPSLGYLEGLGLSQSPRTRVELTHRNCVYQITIRGGPLAERRRIAGAILSLIAEDPSLELDDWYWIYTRLAVANPLFDKAK